MMPADFRDPASWRSPPEEGDLKALERRVKDLEQHVNWILGQAANWSASRDKDREHG